MTPHEATLERARGAARAGAILARAGEHDEAELSFDRARTAYALLVDDASARALALPVLDARAELAVFGPVRLRRRRFARLVPLLVVLAGTGAYVAFALGVRPFADVNASAVFADDPMFAGRMAVDGQPETEWLLPDHQVGTLDLTLFPSRAVRRIAVRNGHNRQFLDRAVQRYEVELIRDGVRVHVVRGRFAGVRAEGDTQTFVLARPVRGVDHVRFVVRDSHGLGAALAELRVR